MIEIGEELPKIVMILVARERKRRYSVRLREHLVNGESKHIIQHPFQKGFQKRTTFFQTRVIIDFY